MEKATLDQGHQLDTFLLRENDPKGFIQNLLSNWGAVQTIGRGEIDQATFEAAVKEVVNPFAEEKTELSWFYPDGWKPISIEDQLKVLAGIYPDLDVAGFVNTVLGTTVSKDEDGIFVIPKLSSVAATLGIEDPFGEDYGKLLESTVLPHLARQRKFHNYRAGELTSDRVRMRQSAIEAILISEEEQLGDFIVISAQTGKKWGGYSPQNARWNIERKSKNEFPLPAWVVGHILLTNPTRLDRTGILWIDCPGDEYRFEDDAEFRDCLYFRFDGGQLEFDYGWLDNASDYCGSASGFSG